MTTEPATTQEQQQNKASNTSNSQRSIDKNLKPLISEILRVGPLKSIQKYIREKPNIPEKHTNKKKKS